MAKKVTIWKKVKVAMQSALATEVTITAISKASPAVATVTNTLANGDFVLLVDVQGMSELNNKIIRVTGRTASAISLEGVDATGFGDFVSGKLQKITFATEFTTLLDVSASGGETGDIDTTTIHDDQASAIPGLASASIFQFNSFWDGADVALLAAKAASDASTPRAIMFTFSNGQKHAQNCYIGCALNPSGSAQEKVTTPVKFSANGPSTTYAS